MKIGNRGLIYIKSFLKEWLVINFLCKITYFYIRHPIYSVTPSESSNNRFKLKSSSLDGSSNALSNSDVISSYSFAIFRISSAAWDPFISFVAETSSRFDCTTDQNTGYFMKYAVKDSTILWFVEPWLHKYLSHLKLLLFPLLRRLWPGIHKLVISRRDRDELEWTNFSAAILVCGSLTKAFAPALPHLIANFPNFSPGATTPVTPSTPSFTIFRKYYTDTLHWCTTMQWLV